jgi:SAM-dependent methyltransferase
VSELTHALTSSATLRDEYFDRFLPTPWRLASGRFWTPLDAVKRASEWLEELGVRTVVDIGSGVGKFCIAGALLTSCAFIGVEQRSHLTLVARNLSRVLGVEQRVSFVEGRFGEIAMPTADCYYLYNPFEENLFAPEEALDDAVDLNASRFRRELRAFRALVGSLPLGAFVLTYNGVGGRWPDCLEERRVDRELPAVLRLLEKVRL